MTKSQKPRVIMMKKCCRKYYYNVMRSIPKVIFVSISICFIISSFYLEESMAFTLTTNTIQSPRIKHEKSLSSSSSTKASSSTTTTQLGVRKKKPMPIIGYNGEDICDYYDRRPLVVGWRLNILSLPLLGTSFETKKILKSKMYTT